jgi:hypothetical protein
MNLVVSDAARNCALRLGGQGDDGKANGRTCAAGAASVFADKKGAN